ncbi:MAG: MarR family transcriptional regulator [Paracoccaceae bacterium]
MAFATLCNCLALRQATRKITQIYDRHLAPAGLRITQYCILSQLSRLGPLTINALADELILDRTTLGRTMQPLERDGLIAVELCTEDRRAKKLRITENGEQKLAEALPYWRQAQAELDGEFGAARAAALRAELRALVAAAN